MDVISPDDPRVKAGFQNAKDETEFWQKHQDELLREYPDQFVAVVDGEVEASAPDLQQLLYLLRGKGIEPSRAWVRLMATRPRQMIL